MSMMDSTGGSPALKGVLGSRAELLETLFDAIPAYIFVVDQDVKIHTINASAASLLGANRESFLPIRGGDALRCLNAVENRQGCGHSEECKNCLIRNSVAESFRGRKIFRETSRLVLVDEGKLTDVYFMVTATPFVFNGGEYVLLVLENVTDLKKAEKTAEDMARRLRNITSVLGEGVFVLDARGRFTFVNPEAERILGWKEEEILGREVHEVIHFQGADGSPIPAEECPAMRTILSGTTYRAEEEALARKDGTVIPVFFVTTPLIEEGRVVGSVASFHDMTERRKAREELKRANELLEKQATTDALTGIFNRLKFDELLKSELSRAKRYALPLSLIMFDIDHFKKINDTYGHQAGDLVLKELTGLVAGDLRTPDIFARWGGEEFIILVPHDRVEEARELAERLRTRIAHFHFSIVWNVTCSFGVTGLRGDDDLNTFVKRADDALYKAKNGGRDRLELL